MKVLVRIFRLQYDGKTKQIPLCSRAIDLPDDVDVQKILDLLTTVATSRDALDLLTIKKIPTEQKPEIIAEGSHEFIICRNCLFEVLKKTTHMPQVHDLNRNGECQICHKTQPLSQVTAIY
jgi:hypothetical protein